MTQKSADAKKPYSYSHARYRKKNLMKKGEYSVKIITLLPGF